MASYTSYPTNGDITALYGLFPIAIAILYGPAILAYLLSVTGLSSRVSRFINDRAFQAKGCPEDSLEYASLLARMPLYFGIDPFIFPKGIPRLLLEPGAFEDFVRYLLNEHSVLGMFFCDERHPFGKFSRAMIFCAINCNVFLWFTFASEAYLHQDSLLYYAWQYIFMLPTRVLLTISFNQLFQTSCCTIHSGSWNYCRAASNVLVTLFALLGLLWIFLFLNILSEANATKAQAQAQIIAYMYEITIVSGALEALVLFRLFLTFRYSCTSSCLNVFTLNVCCCKKYYWIEEKLETNEKADDATTAIASLITPNLNAPPPSSAFWTGMFYARRVEGSADDALV